MGKSKQQAVKPKAITCSWSLLLSAALLIYTLQRSLKQQAISRIYLPCVFSLSTVTGMWCHYSRKGKWNWGWGVAAGPSVLVSLKGQKDQETVKPVPASLATVEPFYLHLCWWLCWDWPPAGPSPPLLSFEGSFLLYLHKGEPWYPF